MPTVKEMLMATPLKDLRELARDLGVTGRTKKSFVSKLLESTGLELEESAPESIHDLFEALKSTEDEGLSEVATPVAVQPPASPRSTRTAPPGAKTPERLRKLFHDAPGMFSTPERRELMKDELKKRALADLDAERGAKRQKTDPGDDAMVIDAKPATQTVWQKAWGKAADSGRRQLGLASLTTLHDPSSAAAQEAATVALMDDRDVVNVNHRINQDVLRWLAAPSESLAASNATLVELAGKSKTLAAFLGDAAREDLEAAPESLLESVGRAIMYGDINEASARAVRTALQSIFGPKQQRAASSKWFSEWDDLDTFERVFRAPWGAWHGPRDLDDVFMEARRLRSMGAAPHVVLEWLKEVFQAMKDAMAEWLSSQRASRPVLAKDAPLGRESVWLRRRSALSRRTEEMKASLRGAAVLKAVQSAQSAASATAAGDAGRHGARRGAGADAGGIAGGIVGGTSGDNVGGGVNSSADDVKESGRKKRQPRGKPPRLDDAQFAKLMSELKTQKMCTQLALFGECRKGDACPAKDSHSAMSGADRDSLVRTLLKEEPVYQES